MTLWPPQDQADEDMWAEYKRRTARPGLLEEEAAAEQAKQQQAGESPQRRGRVSENPQPEKDA
jgi:hypothetical protein